MSLRKRIMAQSVKCQVKNVNISVKNIRHETGHKAFKLDKTKQVQYTIVNVHASQKCRIHSAALAN